MKEGYYYKETKKNSNNSLPWRVKKERNKAKNYTSSSSGNKSYKILFMPNKMSPKSERNHVNYMNRSS